MPKYLITNSDDFGLSNSITDAIVKTHIDGIMKSTTLIVNMPGFDYAVKRSKEIDTLGIGIHFNLTEGKPITSPSSIPELVNKDGNFLANKKQRKNLLYGKEKVRQVKIELSAQLEKLLDNGIVPTHFDSHHHITGLPCAFKASKCVAKEYGINKARVTNTDFCFKQDDISFFKKLKLYTLNLPKALIHKLNARNLKGSGFITPGTKLLPSRVLPKKEDPEEQFIQALSILKEGITEISFHPGFQDSYPNDSLKTSGLRVKDLKVATSDKVQEYIRNNNIKLISFKDL